MNLDMKKTFYDLRPVNRPDKSRIIRLLETTRMRSDTKKFLFVCDLNLVIVGVI